MAEKIEHDWHNPCKGCNPGGCMWCDGGLECCRVCGAFEGATPDDCPGFMMQPDESDAVYKGLRNFRDGMWRNECAQVMRHIYDIDNLMAESGYVKDGLNNAGNTKWYKLPVAEWVKVL